MHTTFPARTLLAAALFSCLPVAAAGDWTLEANLRARQEQVRDAAFAHDADATTLRLRAGLHGRFANGWEALVEGEGIASAGAFNDGSNGRTAWPVVADPNGAELNQAWLRHAGERLTATAGRQRLLLANQRWIGNSGWRQNEQTFDAVALDVRPGGSIEAHYAWLGRVHRINGDDARDPLARERSLDSHYAELAWKRGAWQLAPYALLHRDRDVATASTHTFGLRGAWDVSGGGRSMATVHADLGWRHAWGDLTPDAVVAFADGDAFTVHAPAMHRNAAVYRLRLGLSPPPRSRLAIGLDGLAGDGARAIAGHLQWQLSF